eukprot:1040873-Prymnesium_polylepis.1
MLLRRQRPAEPLGAYADATRAQSRAADGGRGAGEQPVDVALVGARAVFGPLLLDRARFHAL